MGYHSSHHSGTASRITLNPKKQRGRRYPLLADVLIAVLCAGGLTLSTLYDAHIRQSHFSASDFKTLYASTWSFAHGIDAYKISNLQRVFVDNSVVQPPAWYGHSPVYPWTTLALLAPLALLPMVHAVYLMSIVTGVLLAAAIAALMRYSAVTFGLGFFWRVLLAGLCISGPLLTFGMDMGNVSVACAALCVLAFVWRGVVSTRWRPMPWVPGIALALALILKPHLALWVAIGMALLPERASRAAVARAAVFLAGFTAATAAVMAATGSLGMQTHSYLAMLGAERSAGASMSAVSRELLPVVSQITSVESIFGFWITNAVARGALTVAVLAMMAVLLFRATRRVDTEGAALLAVAGWSALGMLATYHRTHDGALLILFFPWAVRRLTQQWTGWIAFALYAAMSVSFPFGTIVDWVARLPQNSPLTFLLSRQAALADMLLVLAIVLSMRMERVGTAVEDVEIPELETVRGAA